MEKLRLTNIPITEDSMNKVTAANLSDAAQDYLNDNDVNGMREEVLSAITKAWVRGYRYAKSE